MKWPACSLLALCSWGCSSDPASVVPASGSPGAPDDSTETSTPGDEMPSSVEGQESACEADCADDPPPASPAGTQTGGEGELIFCGDGPARWMAVSETLPLEGAYAGQVQLSPAGMTAATLTLSNAGDIQALDLEGVPSYFPECAKQRFTNIDWALDIDGVLVAGGRAGMSYALERGGELHADLGVPDATLEIDPATPEDFRAAGDPLPGGADAGAPAEGPVTIGIYASVGGGMAMLSASWRCAHCGSSLVGLALADGTLTKPGEPTSAEGTRPPGE